MLYSPNQEPVTIPADKYDYLVSSHTKYDYLIDLLLYHIGYNERFECLVLFGSRVILETLEILEPGAIANRRRELKG